MSQTEIYKYLSGDSSEKEVELLFQWIEASAENRKAFIQYKQAWALTSRSQDNVNHAWRKMNKGMAIKNNSLNIIPLWLKYAAVVILLMGVGGLMQYFVSNANSDVLFTEYTQVEVPVGQMSKVTLPDGTLVHLNSESKLVYSNHFASGERIVELTGEGYFNVHSDKEHPFIVKTPSTIAIKVYGTAFNLCAYPGDNKIHTTLEEGRVSIIDKTGKELTKLVPGEKATYFIEASSLQIERVKTELYSSWKEGLITFRNERMENIARMIERWYNVEIVFENEKRASELYNGTLMKNKPIDQILEVFKLTSSLEYKIVQRPDKSALVYWK